MKIALLPDRAVLEISGEDRVAFLQGLISNDVTKARADQGALTKKLADFSPSQEQLSIPAPFAGPPCPGCPA